MSVQLLDKTRKINKLLHNSSSSKVVFNDICQVLMDTLSSNILVLSKKGKVLGVSFCPGVEEIRELIIFRHLVLSMFPAAIRESSILLILQENVLERCLCTARIVHMILRILLSVNMVRQ